MPKTEPGDCFSPQGCLSSLRWQALFPEAFLFKDSVWHWHLRAPPPHHSFGSSKHYNLPLQISMSSEPEPKIRSSRIPGSDAEESVLITVSTQDCYVLHTTENKATCVSQDTLNCCMRVDLYFFVTEQKPHYQKHVAAYWIVLAWECDSHSVCSLPPRLHVFWMIWSGFMFWAFALDITLVSNALSKDGCSRTQPTCCTSACRTLYIHLQRLSKPPTGPGMKARYDLS